MCSSKTVSTKPKIEVKAPMPTPMVNTDTIVNTGARNSRRSECFNSVNRLHISTPRLRVLGNATKAAGVY